MGKNLAQRLFTYLTDFGDREFCRRYNSFLIEFFNKKNREPYQQMLRERKYKDIAVNAACNISDLTSVTIALSSQRLSPLIMIPFTELFRMSCSYSSKREKDGLLEIQRDEIAIHKYESLDQIQREYNKRRNH